MSISTRLSAALSAFRNPTPPQAPRKPTPPQAPRNVYPGTPSIQRSRGIVPLQSARRDLTPFRRRQIQALSRDLESSDGIVNAFLDKAEQYIVGPRGLQLAPNTKDRDWNLLAKESWKNWQRYGNLVSLQGFEQDQSLIARTWLVDGGVFLNRTFSPDSGRPRYQLIEAHRCETPWSRVGDEGKSIIDGVEVDPVTMRPLGYWIRIGDTPTVEQSWMFLDAEFCDHIYEPSRIGQYREIGIFYAVLNDYLDLQELQGYEMGAAKDNASITRTITTQTGEIEEESGIGASLRKETDPDDEDRDIYYRKVLGAETVVLKAGDELKEHRSDRPSVSVQQFWDYVLERATAGSGLHAAILVSRPGVNGTVMRAYLDMANDWFRARSAALAGYFGRVYEWVIENEIKSGNLKNAPADWRAWKFTAPKAINVDIGRNSAATIAELGAGVTTYDEVYGRSGRDWEEAFWQKGYEMSVAQKVADHYGLRRAEIIRLDPNELSAGEPVDPDPSKPDPSKPDEKEDEE